MTRGVWNVPADERVAALHEQAERYGGPAAGLSDLELLNQAYDSVLREQIDTRDRYMSLLTSLRGHDDQVREGAVAGFRPQIDRIARHVVSEHLRPYEHLLYRVEHLADGPSREQVASLRSSATAVRHALREDGPAEERLDPGDARHTLSTLRSVITILQDREDLTAEDALGLMNNALNDGPLLDLFHVGTPSPMPTPPPPAFAAGPDWTYTPNTWTYQPAPDSGYVKAYPLGQDWYLDLWSAHGHLLAYGSAPESDVAALAPALVEQAGTWVRERSDYAWRRFNDTRDALNTTQAPANGEGERVRAATASSPGRPADPTAPPPASSRTPASPTPPASPAASPRRR